MYRISIPGLPLGPRPYAKVENAATFAIQMANDNGCEARVEAPNGEVCDVQPGAEFTEVLNRIAALTAEDER